MSQDTHFYSSGIYPLLQDCLRMLISWSDIPSIMSSGILSRLDEFRIICHSRCFKPSWLLMKNTLSPSCKISPLLQFFQNAGEKYSVTTVIWHIHTA